jgi:hypothetical protein
MNATFRSDRAQHPGNGHVRRVDEGIPRVRTKDALFSCCTVTLLWRVVMKWALLATLDPALTVAAGVDATSRRSS